MIPNRSSSIFRFFPCDMDQFVGVLDLRERLFHFHLQDRCQTRKIRQIGTIIAYRLIFLLAFTIENLFYDIYIKNRNIPPPQHEMVRVG
jgi:hypothetical protein